MKRNWRRRLIWIVILAEQPIWKAKLPPPNGDKQTLAEAV
jgi:hypothetical protein